MRVLSVLLRDFRNIKYLEISLSPGINLFYGMNGQGKTNILESIEILSTTRSQRASRESELVRHEAEDANISGKFQKNGLDFEILINLHKNKRKTCVKNGKPASADAVFGSVNVVKFFPDDVEIIKGAPQLRRKYIDMEISLTDRLYYQDYKNYTKLIEARNQVLKAVSDYRPQSVEYADAMNTIASYDELIPGYAYSIYSGRMRFINEIGEAANRTHLNISSGSEETSMRYLQNNFENDYEQKVLSGSEFKEKLIFLLKKNLKNDILKRLTGTGPHRDDIEFLINGTSARSYGSTGQVKTLAVSLKLAQIEYVYKKVNDYPALLIDDLTSEFDTERLFNIINSISNDIQVMVTSTNQKIFIDAFKEREASYFEIAGGDLRKP